MKDHSGIGAIAGFAAQAAAVTAAVIFSIVYLDQPLARFVSEVFKRHRMVIPASRIPDLLPLIVIGLVAVAWVSFAFLRATRRAPRVMSFCQMTGIALPLAFAVKAILQIIFGRINAPVWMQHPTLHQFHFLHPTSHFFGFPSGHMTVFVAFLLSMRDFLPGLKALWVSLCVLLAAALFLTGAHFLGDIIAGGYLGFLAHALTAGWIRHSQGVVSRAGTGE